jgi:hypothetical protein
MHVVTLLLFKTWRCTRFLAISFFLGLLEDRTILSALPLQHVRPHQLGMVDSRSMKVVFLLDRCHNRKTGPTIEEYEERLTCRLPGATLLAQPASTPQTLNAEWQAQVPTGRCPGSSGARPCWRATSTHSYPGYTTGPQSRLQHVLASAKLPPCPPKRVR